MSDDDGAPVRHGVAGGAALWHGRFAEAPADALMEFTASISIDRVMWRDDIAGSRAHVAGLAHGGLIEPAERDAVLSALDVTAGEMERGEFTFVVSDQEIHTALERRGDDIAGASRRQ